MQGIGLFLGAIDLDAFMALSIPLLALLIPIVAILVHHQQKMAQIMRGSDPNTFAAIDALRREVADLRQLVGQQSIALDDLRRSAGVQAAPPVEVPNLQGRLSS